MELRHHPHGNYHFLTGIAPYSSAVIAETGYTLARARFPAPTPYRAGFQRIADVLAQFNRPKQALCAVELRIPEPLSFQGFIDFNQAYCAVLQDWDIYVSQTNPVARTNVAPGVAAPQEPSIYAFTFTLPAMPPLDASTRRPDSPPFDAPGASNEPSFVVAGAGDLSDQADLRAEAIVRPGETSPDAMLDKAESVLQVMQERLTGIDRSWAHVLTTNVYTVEPLHALHSAMLLPRLGAAAIHGVNWYYSHPPIAGLAFEMDLRSVEVEIVVP